MLTFELSGLFQKTQPNNPDCVLVFAAGSGGLLLGYDNGKHFQLPRDDVGCTVCLNAQGPCRVYIRLIAVADRHHMQQTYSYAGIIGGVAAMPDFQYKFFPVVYRWVQLGNTLFVMLLQLQSSQYKHQSYHVATRLLRTGISCQLPKVCADPSGCICKQRSTECGLSAVAETTSFSKKGQIQLIASMPLSFLLAGGVPHTLD